jgi:hypothetical protein
MNKYFVGILEKYFGTSVVKENEIGWTCGMYNEMRNVCVALFESLQENREVEA